MEANQKVEVVADSNEELSRDISQNKAANTQQHNQQAILKLLATAPAAPANLQQQTNQDELDNISSTSKKGVLWQQQNYDKFHQRLFSRWKKRYFILTTDYLVCFKRSSSKVGRSEMGKFLYKTALSDVTKIEWLKPKKSDKGAIVLHLSGPYNLLLWTKQNLDDWMFMIDESIQRNKLRRSFIQQNGADVKKTTHDENEQDALISKQTRCNIPESELKTAQLPTQEYTKNNQLENDNLSTGATDDLYENTGSEPVTDREAQQQQKFGEAISRELNNNDASLLLSSTDPVIKSQTITKYSTKVSNQSLSSCERQPSPVSSACNKHHRSQQSSSTHEKSDGIDTEEKSQKDESLQAAIELSSLPNVDNSIKHEETKGATIEIGRQTQALKSNDDQASGRKLAVIYDPSNSAGSGNDDNGSTGPNAATSSLTANATTNQPEMLSDAGMPPKSKGSSKKKAPADVEEQMQKSPSRQDRIPDKSSQEKKKKARGKKSKSSLVKNKEQPITDEAPPVASTDAENQHESSQADNEAERKSVQSNEGVKKTKLDGKKCNISSNQQDTDAVTEELSHLVRDKSHLEDKVILHLEDQQQHQKRRNHHLNHQLQSTNLIRRDDSWQSLVSLTRVGKVTPALQVAQRSLYAQHIMPDDERLAVAAAGGDKQFSGYHQSRISAIESAVTPSRVSLSASSHKQHNQRLQQPISAGPVNQRKFRPLPPLVAGQLPHAPASFEVSAPSSPGLSNQRQPGGVSYQQKLVQLQLLHNSNNVDYIRRGGEDSANDYGIYDASASQLYGYGYSSMRSQLKSAASEFSFIRPSPSSNNPANPALPHANFTQHQTQSTLPHNRALHSPNTRNIKHQQQQLILSNSSLGVGPSMQVAGNAINESDNNNNDLNRASDCMSPLAKQYLVHPVTGERIINQQDRLLVAPMRELPMKPNKKRGAAANLQDAGVASGGQMVQAGAKSSSLTASIACFFRRAFSRRSKSHKKRVKSKLAESSSSLGAFGDDAPAAYPPLVPSAFSTGSKSVNGQQPHQQQRMVDMIEAFTNQTRISQQQIKATPQKLSVMRDNLDFNLDVSVIEGTPRQQQRRPKLPAPGLNQQHFGGSPLHKSNSISATMGLSHAYYGNDLNVDTRAAQLYDNAMICADGSPMMMRRNKVLSANLTPLLNRGAHLEEASREMNQQQQQLQRLFLSPRNGHLPRPSSIYGQPSMISSPVFTGRDGDRSQFGVHRNSFHNQHFRERNLVVPDDLRRHHQMQMHQFSLDTTREVNEEVSSPMTSEAPPVLTMGDIMQDPQEILQKTPYSKQQYSVRRADAGTIISSPSSGKLYQRHKAVVNPILQSPTMSTIYDNHPIVMRNNVDLDGGHYDNHNQLLVDGFQHAIHPSPSLVRTKQQTETPSHHQRSVFETNERALSMLINNSKKPSAIVAPTTPSHHDNKYSSGGNNNHISNSPKLKGDLCSGQNLVQPQIHGSPIIQLQSRSPMLSRRVHSNSTSQHYQQSPLIGQQTRVLNKGDGVQATILENAARDGDSGAWSQPVVNIAGAPGINLDPTLAASLLKGTNIEAYETSTFDRSSLSSGHSNNFSASGNKPKAFLVSTRLSKSMAYSQSSNDNDAGSTSSMLRDEISSQVTSASLLRSSRDELSSSGSRSINSSMGERNSNGRPNNNRKNSRVSTTGSSNGPGQNDDQAESSGSDTREPKSVILNNRRKGSKQGESSLGSEPSIGETSSQVDDENDNDLDGLKRNWITSKLTATGTGNE